MRCTAVTDANGVHASAAALDCRHIATYLPLALHPVWRRSNASALQSATLDGCTLERNQAGYGAAPAEALTKGASSSSGAFTSGGGALAVEGAVQVEVRDSSFVGNQALVHPSAGGGGSLAAFSGPRLVLAASSFTGDTALGPGGSVLASACTSLDLVDTTIATSTSTAAYGGGLAAINIAAFASSGLYVRDSTAPLGGGAYIAGGAESPSLVLMEGCTFTNNTAVGKHTEVRFTVPLPICCITATKTA